MKLHRLVEIIRNDWAEAQDWPVMFTAYRRQPSGEWQEVDSPEPVTSVKVETENEEVLLIRAPERAPLTASSLQQELSALMPEHSDFLVDTCQPPVAVEGGGSIPIDLPIVGWGRSDERRCCLVVFASAAT